MKIFIPKVIKNVLITEDIDLATKYTINHCKKRHYLPIIEPPRITRPDASNEVIKINNAIARAGCNFIILGNLSEEEKQIIKPQFASNITKEICAVEGKTFSKKAKLKVNLFGVKNLGIGILKSIKDQNQLVLNDEVNVEERFFKGNTDLLFIVEDRQDITSVIIANYAYSFGASLLYIDSIERNIITEINDQFFHIYEKTKNITEELKIISQRLSEFIPNINPEQFSSITFFTSGLPYGFSFPQKPTTHIFNYPMLGTNLLSYIGVENNQNTNIKIGLLVDPGHFDETEAQTFVHSLRNRNVIVRKLSNKEATISNAHLFISEYPADVILISSHSNETNGFRYTYNYVDSENISRELIVDEAVSLGWNPVTQNFHATTYTHFVAIDGIDWNNIEMKNKHYIGKAIIDFIEMQKQDLHIEKRVNEAKVNKVYGAMAYGMIDGNFLPALQGIGGLRYPIIISNACSSWRKVSKDVSYAGSRLYLGPIIDVINSEAIKFIEILFNKYLDHPISVGVWRTQNDLYQDQIRRPYLLLGTHFTKFNFTKNVETQYLKDQLAIASNNLGQIGVNGKSADVRENAKKFEMFLFEEAAKFNYCLRNENDLYEYKK